MTQSVEQRSSSDQVLWDAAVAGDAESLGRLFDRYHQRLYTYCFRRCGSWADAEDLVATVFLEAWRTRRQMQLQDDSLLPWLYGVATNVTGKHHRASGRYQAALERLATRRDVARDTADEVVERLADEQQMQRILAGFAQLPGRERAVLELAFFAELDYAAIGAALDLPIGTVRSRLSRGKERLRGLVGSDELLSIEGETR